MERRGIAEAGGAALGSAVLAIGLAFGIAIAAAANYRARTGHADAVEAE